MSSEEDDVMFKLIQRALYVELPTRPIDLDTVPTDGNEFIHKAKLEDANLLSEQVSVPVKPPEENEEKLMRQWARKAAAEFSRYGLKLSSDKDKMSLKKKFPKKLYYPRHDPKFIRDWCQFCLGSELCSEIYGRKYKKPIKEIKGHRPLLSIIVHFNQLIIFTLLKHLHEWFLKLGMEDSLGRWIYAVLACIKKPLDDDFENLIETFFKSCKRRLKDSDEFERVPLHLISAILEHYFCINFDKIGPTVESF